MGERMGEQVEPGLCLETNHSLVKPTETNVDKADGDVNAKQGRGKQSCA